MVKKMRVSLALQPLATALFADSPFTEGKPNGFQSYRSHIWTDTDPDRCGMLPFVFEPGMGFERYVDYMLDVPMYFVYRDGKLHRCQRAIVPRLHGRAPAGTAGRDSRHGRLGRPYDAPPFPEVRLKRYLEMRGADGGPLGPALRAAGALGRAALRFDVARCQHGTSSRTGRWWKWPSCAARCRSWR